MKTRFGPALKPISQGVKDPSKLALYPTEERKDVKADNLRRDKIRLLAHKEVYALAKSMASRGVKK